MLDDLTRCQVLKNQGLKSLTDHGIETPTLLCAKNGAKVRRRWEDSACCAKL